MLAEKISQLLLSCSTNTPFCPPTEFHNEVWLLRLVLDWFATHEASDHALGFSASARWFAGAHLPTTFTERHQDDRLAEKRTPIDGAIGHFTITFKNQKARLALLPDAQQFVVLNAEMFGTLSGGIKNARYFDQAARTAACMAETLSRANRYPVDMARIGFYVLAPQAHIDHGTFAEYLSRESIRQKVKQRVKAYDDKTKKRWYSEWADPTIDQMTLDTLSWESVLAYISAGDTTNGPALADFYERCIHVM